MKGLIDDLKYHDNENFNEDFLSKTKTELPKYLEYVKKFQFDFEADVENPHLYYSCLKTRTRKAKNRAAVDLMQEYQRAQ